MMDGKNTALQNVEIDWSSQPQLLQAQTSFANDLYSTLNGLVSITTLFNDSSLNDSQKNYVTLILNYSKTLMSMAADFQYFIGLQTSNTALQTASAATLRTAEVDLPRLVDSVVEDLVKPALEKGIVISSFVGESVPKLVMSDSAIIRQLMQNILIFPLSEVMVKAELVQRVKDVATVRISFTGINFDERSVGKSLKLPTIALLVQLIKGQLTLNKETNALIITIPFDVSPMLNEINPPRPKEPAIGINVLLLEPNKAVADITKNYLLRISCSCQIAIDSQHAWSILCDSEVNTFQLIIACLQLGTVEKKQFMNDLKRSKYWYVPVIMLSSSTNVVEKDVRRAGFVSYIVKPVTLPKLLVSISSLFLDHTQQSYYDIDVPPIPMLAPPNEALSSFNDYSREKRASMSEEFAQPAAKRQCTRSTRSSKSILKVMVVDDNFVNQKVLKNVLLKLSLDCELVSDGIEALEKYKANCNAYSVILMDSLMPKMDGFQATEEIREFERDKNLHIPIIAVTAIGKGDNPLDNAEEHCLACGMDDYLPKPIVLNQLKEKLQKWLPTKEPEPTVFPVKLQQMCVKEVISSIVAGNLNTLDGMSDEIAQEILDTMAEKLIPTSSKTLALFKDFKIKRLRLIPTPPWKADLILQDIKAFSWGDTLTELDTSSCTYLSDHAFGTLLDHAVLMQLTICVCFIEEFITVFKELTSINLSYCPRLTNMCVYAISTLKKLITVDLRGCDLLTEEGIGVLRSLAINFILCNSSTELKLAQ